MNNTLNRNLLPGEDWVYFEIYCGVNTSEFFLQKKLKPIINKLLKSQVIDKWYFIRYSLPDSHLRIRFHLNKKKYIIKLINLMNEIVKPLMNNNLVWDLKLCTYKREIERYGENTIQLVEEYFFQDTINVLLIIERSNGDSGRFVDMCSYLEKVIDLFEMTEEDVLSFLNRRQKEYKEEFSSNRETLKRLNKKYKTLLVEKDNYFDLNGLRCIATKLVELNKLSALQISLKSLLSSFIHMSVNRAFKTKQRLYEMIIYDFLNRKYESKKFRIGQ